MIRYLASVLTAVSLSLLLVHSAQAQTDDTTTEVETEAEAETEVTPAPIAPNSSPEIRPRTPQPSSQVNSVPEKKSNYYGSSILMTDLTALGVGALAVATLSTSSSSGAVGGTLLVGAGLTYVLGGPIVHATHGNTGTAFGSFGLRLGLPVGGALVGGLIGGQMSQGCSGDFCELGGALAGGLVGFVGGMITASIIDISLLAYEDDPTSAAPRMTLVPAIDPKQGSASVNVQGIW